LRLYPLTGLEIVMVAPGMAAPVESATVPETLPVVCAKALLRMKMLMKKSAADAARRMVVYIHCLPGGYEACCLYVIYNDS
jgi:hypothetical protein